MKSKASTFLKQMVSTVVAAVRAKSTVVRAKTSALKTRLLVLGVLRNKKLLMTSISHKIQAIMGQQQQQQEQREEEEKIDAGDEEAAAAVVPYAAPRFSFSAELGTHGAAEAGEEQEEGSDADEYLTHSLFAKEGEDDDELVKAPGSVIDVMRGAKEREEGEGAEFRLEDEIDHVADVFIRRIHRQLKLQKLDSFKRLCEMLERGAAA